MSTDHNSPAFTPSIVSDGQLSTSDDVIVTAVAATLTTNKVRVVNAGIDQAITFPATLSATATDDGLPNGVLSYLWTVINGTGVTLSSPTALSPRRRFLLPVRIRSE